MNLFANPRSRRHGAATDTGRDPIPDAIGDSLWLGGEAMVAPGWLADVRAPAAHPDCADPDWLAI